VLILGCKDHDQWGGKGLRPTNVIVQTEKGQVIAFGARVVCTRDGEQESACLVPLAVTFYEDTARMDWEYELHSEGRKGYICLYGKRVVCENTAVVFADDSKRDYRVLKGVHWDHQLFEDKAKLEAFVKKVVESMDVVVPDSATTKE